MATKFSFISASRSIKLSLLFLKTLDLEVSYIVLDSWTYIARNAQTALRMLSAWLQSTLSRRPNISLDSKLKLRVLELYRLSMGIQLQLWTIKIDNFDQPFMIPTPPPLEEDDSDLDTVHEYDSDIGRDNPEFLELDSDYEFEEDTDETWDEIALKAFHDEMVEWMVELEEQKQAATDLDYLQKPVKQKIGHPKHYQSFDNMAWFSTPGASGSGQMVTVDSDSDIEIIDPPSHVPSSPLPDVSKPLLHTVSSPPPVIVNLPCAPSSPPPVIGCPWSASVLSAPSVYSDDEVNSFPPCVAPPPTAKTPILPEEEEYSPEEWDCVLDEIIDSRAGHGGADDGNRGQPVENSVEIRDWSTLWEQIKQDMKKNLSLSKYNQLLILHNFATLRIKGYKRIEASHDIACQWHEGEGIHFA
ncbi:hypothetical protein EDD18DRAFT_1109726 [Armillaria luteobubalina]|uniref:Uncharacterized protein n=1 Tax=Armillaria luteobubalina TaxID=153913 RepID=A0AA39PW27_9AGAR|nr:hypothetical protein EDD18DRAFT_1109726 [Armillaria luteobubalina]